MTRLEELSQISTAVLTPHLNCDLKLISNNEGEAVFHEIGKLSKYDIEFRKRWCKRQWQNIGLFGAVIEPW